MIHDILEFASLEIINAIFFGMLLSENNKNSFLGMIGFTASSYLMVNWDIRKDNHIQNPFRHYTCIHHKFR